MNKNIQYLMKDKYLAKILAVDNCPICDFMDIKPKKTFFIPVKDELGIPTYKKHLQITEGSYMYNLLIEQYGKLPDYIINNE